MGPLCQREGCLTPHRLGHPETSYSPPTKHPEIPGDLSLFEITLKAMLLLR